jgi:hypothetical protein
MTADKLEEFARRCRDAAGQMAVLQCEPTLPESMRYQITQITRDISELRGFFLALRSVNATRETEKLSVGRRKPGGPLKTQEAAR